MMASSRGRTRSSPRDSKGFGRIGCLLDQAEEHAIMNRAETEDGSYASARNRKVLAGLGLKSGENEYADPALTPCQRTAYAFFTGDQLSKQRPNRSGSTRLTRARSQRSPGMPWWKGEKRRRTARWCVPQATMSSKSSQEAMVAQVTRSSTSWRG